MGSLARRLSRFAAIIGISILAVSSLVWVFFHTEGFTQPIDLGNPTPTPLPSPTTTPGVTFPAIGGAPQTVILCLAGLFAVLFLLLLLLVFARGRRKNQPVTVQ